MGAQAAGLDVTPPPPPPWSRSCWQEGKGSFTSLRINLLFHSHFLFVLSKIIREKKRGGGGAILISPQNPLSTPLGIFYFHDSFFKAACPPVWGTGTAAAAGGGSQARRIQTCLLEDRLCAGRKVQGTVSFFRAGGSKGYLQVNQSNCRLQYFITDQLCRERRGVLPAAPVPRGYWMPPPILPLQFHMKPLISTSLTQSCFWELLTGPY